MTNSTDVYLEYINEETGTHARWWGGEYIELGYIAETDSSIVNDQGDHSHYAGDWVAVEVINTHGADGEPRIPFTREALADEIEGDSDDDED